MVKENALFSANTSISIAYYVFIFFLLLTGGISFIYLPPDQSLIGISRMMIMPLTVIMFYNLYKSENIFINQLSILVFIIFLACISLILQATYGQEISIFGVPSLRSGLIRYSTSLGSITIFGQAVGIAFFLILTLKYKKITKTFLIAVIIIAVGISLSKSGVMNILIASTLVLFYVRKLSYIFIILLLFVSFYFLIIIFNEFIIFKYLNTMLFTAFRINLLDSTIPLGTPPVDIESIFDRLLGKFDLWDKNIYEIIFGIGVKGGAGAMGVKGVTSHNSYIDIWQMGGFSLIISFIILQITTLINLFKLDTNTSTILFFSNIIIIANMFVQNGVIFQPVTSFIFWMSVSYLIFNNSKKNVQ
ncbi:hypothetical protein N9C93_00325 [Pelagibacterales bacterium]|nr:hypothetical protein [Pelagibacterales bacterium]